MTLSDDGKTLNWQGENYYRAAPHNHTSDGNPDEPRCIECRARIVSDFDMEYPEEQVKSLRADIAELQRTHNEILVIVADVKDKVGPIMEAVRQPGGITKLLMGGL